MSTQASTRELLRRVVVRASVGLWRHRGGVLLAAVVSTALGGYVSLTGAGALPLLAAGTVNGGSDCADTAMAAMTNTSPAVAAQAYQCMDSTFQQRVTEQAFTQQMQTVSVPSVDKLARVGDYHSPAGGTMVYYALDGAGQSVGYIVYLGQNGKVLKIE